MRPQQATFAEAGFEAYYKPTRREQFLAEMERVVPWAELGALIEPFYPKNDGAGRPTVGLERMLRIYFLQQWFNLSDPAVEEALYDSRAMRAFVGIDLGREGAPDETTVCKFRHLLEVHSLGEQVFALMNAHLHACGLTVSRGTIVDATIINAPSSTKNKTKTRDPEMRQTKKGNQWYFGMKAHVGVDSKTKLIHSVVATPANVHDSQCFERLLDRNNSDPAVYADSAYRSEDHERLLARRGFKSRVHHRAWGDQPLTKRRQRENRARARVRARVEHVFGHQVKAMRQTLVRGIGLARIRTRIVLTNLAYNMSRLAQLRPQCA